MPFPLAHPAAVLPLRRFAPQWLCFPALVIGSMAPDLGYLFERWDMSDVAHRFIGSAVFSLPVGLLVYVLFRVLRVPLVKTLPERWRDAFLPLCQHPLGSWYAVVISIILGAWSHFLWDSFTHKDGWLTMHFTFLQAPVAMVGYRHFRVCHLLWYLSTLGGVAWITFFSLRWLFSVLAGVRKFPQWVLYLDTFVITMQVFIVAAAHHLAQPPLAIAVAGLVATLIAGGIFWRTMK